MNYTHSRKITNFLFEHVIHGHALIAIIAFIGMCFIYQAFYFHADRNVHPQQIEVPILIGQTSSTDELPILYSWKIYTIKRGDTLARIFSRIGFAPKLVASILQSGSAATHLHHLKPGAKLYIHFDDKYNIEALR